MKTILDLQDLMVRQLRDLYHGENLLLDHIENLAEEAKEPQLRKPLKNYYHDTKDQILRLKQVFNDLFEQKRGEKCEAMVTLINESQELIKETTTPELKDAAMIVSLQHIIHYKIASYGTVCTYGKLIGLWDDIAILHHSLEVEKQMDRNLKQVAEALVNVKVPLYHF